MAIRLNDLFDAHAIFASIGHARTEIAAFAYLDRERHVLAVRQTPIGAVDRVKLPIREVARQALLLNAAGLVMAHNHPSRDCRPSSADIEVTRRFDRVLSALDLKLLDHLIVTPDGMASFRAMGLM